MSLSIDNSDLLYPKRYTTHIRFTALFLKKDKNTITYEDVDKFKNYLEYAINIENLSPNQIQERLNFNVEYFSRTVSNMGIKLKSRKDALFHYNIQSGKAITDEKELYWKECAFQFSPFQYTQMPGYELLFEHQVYHPVNNPTGFHRDHMVSIAYGWENKIDPLIISHPANCEIMLSNDNIKKGSACSITIETLLYRIEKWNNELEYPSKTFISTKYVMPESRKQTISDFNKSQITYTDGVTNIRQHKDLPPPIGFKKGMKSSNKRKPRLITDTHRQNLSNAASKLKSYTNGITNIRQNKNLPVPDGFWTGSTTRLQTEEEKKKEHDNLSKATKDQKYYTNGVKIIRQHKDLPAPFGFVAGRILR